MKPFTDEQRRAAEEAMRRVQKPIIPDTLKVRADFGDPRSDALRERWWTAHVNRAWQSRAKAAAKAALRTNVVRFGGAQGT